jgi:hypothetical protein
LLIIACVLLVRRYVRQHYAGPNEAHRRNLHAQLDLNLFIQVGTPTNLLQSRTSLRYMTPKGPSIVVKGKIVKYPPTMPTTINTTTNAHQV